MMRLITIAVTTILASAAQAENHLTPEDYQVDLGFVLQAEMLGCPLSDQTKLNRMWSVYDTTGNRNLILLGSVHAKEDHAQFGLDKVCGWASVRLRDYKFNQ